MNVSELTMTVNYMCFFDILEKVGRKHYFYDILYLT